MALETGCLIILLFLGLVYIGILIWEDIHNDEFDEIIEARCKRCVYKNDCERRGRDYNCDRYTTEEMLRRKGLK